LTVSPARRAAAARSAKVDLNRDFPDHYRDSANPLALRSPRAGAQPETVAVMAFLLGRSWAAGANFHEGTLVGG
jgi:hypothetical protein